MNLEKVNKIITNLIRIIILGMIFWLMVEKETGNIVILAVTMVLTFYDILITKVLKIKLQDSLKISLILFIFGAQVLGSVLDFYGKFPWWDTMLHTLSGIIFFLVGITLVEQINEKTTKANMNKWIYILFGACFALATGVIWEIIEFMIDTYLGGNMQISKGLVGQEAIKDTMIDLISVTTGSMIMVIIKGIEKRQ